MRPTAPASGPTAPTPSTSPPSRVAGLLRRLTLITVTAGLVGACASTQNPSARTKSDPLEPMNRVVFSFNDAVDRTVLKPVAVAYVNHVNEGYRGMFGNFFGNLGDGWTAVNQLLQGKPYLAFTDLTRFAINSTFGILGLVDLAGEFGLEKHKEDFGQTLGRWGVGPGPYLVLPLLGMSTVRDAAGLVPDYFGNPLIYIDDDAVAWGLVGFGFVNARAALLPAERLLEGATLDKYTALRDAYLQRRRNLVYDGDPPDQAPDYDDPTQD